MKTDSTIHALPVNDRPRSARRAAAVALVALVALGACTSDPGARRVVEDVIRAQANDDPSVDEECMLDRLDEYSDSDLEQITAQLDNANEGTQAEGQAALDAFEADLASCN